MVKQSDLLSTLLSSMQIYLIDFFQNKNTFAKVIAIKFVAQL